MVQWVNCTPCIIRNDCYNSSSVPASMFYGQSWRLSSKRVLKNGRGAEETKLGLVNGYYFKVISIGYSVGIILKIGL
jgi:hypothetical protein